MSSGIAVCVQIRTLFETMQLRSSHAFAVFRIVNDSVISIDHVCTAQDAAAMGARAAYQDLASRMPAAEGRYAVYDLHYELGLEGKRNKLVFIVWCRACNTGTQQSRVCAPA